MQENHFIIPAGDEKHIYGFASLVDGDTDKLVVTAHGLTGNPYEYLHMVARDHFIECGYDVCQFWFYHDEDDARKLHECTLRTHARDLQMVLNHFEDDYSQIFVCGHSYGGLSTVMCNPQNVTAVSLWDPSFKPDRDASLLDEVPEYNGYLAKGHYYGLIGRAMVEEARTISAGEFEAMANDMAMPCQIVLADQSKTFVKNDLKDHLLMDEREVVEIAGADHCFRENSTAFELAEITAEWFDRF